ncbi:MAG: hypothetical protein M1393_02735 [Candidatus Thermoplasmatota archaeon]|jgi:hypothetical protein|nr:hypothetical protein [Candidatus Thermoplasmatota archaeon]MCL6089936.1 hypothetical protein [Candidatus Thermoplasmatota archaeon]
MSGERIVEIQIRKVNQLSDAAKREVQGKLENLPNEFNFKGYVKVSYAESSPLRVVSVDPIEGTINDYFDTFYEKLK